MKSKIFRKLLLFTMISLIGVLGVSTVFAQKKGKDTNKKKVEKIELKATKGTSRGDASDPNIKQGEKANPVNADVPAPKSKGGKSRGNMPVCHIDFDNSSPLYIKIYVDGRYRGTMAPWDDSFVQVPTGLTEVYARADFDDGTYVYWGPRSYNCGNDYKDGYVNFKMTR